MGNLNITNLKPIVSSVVYSATNLPDGLSINPDTGVISGRAADGQYHPTISVTTDWGTTSKTINLLISALPAYPIYRDGVQIDQARFKDIKNWISDKSIENRFQVGDIIVVPWKDPSDNKEYDMPFIFFSF